MFNDADLTQFSSADKRPQRNCPPAGQRPTRRIIETCDDFSPWKRAWAWRLAVWSGYLTLFIGHANAVAIYRFLGPNPLGKIKLLAYRWIERRRRHLGSSRFAWSRRPGTRQSSAAAAAARQWRRTPAIRARRTAPPAAISPVAGSGTRPGPR